MRDPGDQSPEDVAELPDEFIDAVSDSSEPSRPPAATVSDKLDSLDREVYPVPRSDKISLVRGAGSVLSHRDYRGERFGDKLIREDRITPEALDEALQHQRSHGGRLGNVLVELGHLTEPELGRALSEHLGVELYAPEVPKANADIASLVPESLVRKYEMIPIKVSGSTLVVGMVDPTNLMAIDDIRFASGFSTIDVKLVTESTLAQFVEACYGSGSLISEIVQDEQLSFDPMGMDKVEQDDDVRPEETAGSDPVHQLETEASLPPIVRLVNFILLHALEKGASDIHVEPYEESFRIRFRIDGYLHPILMPPVRMHQPFVSRLKILSEMDIAERRKPQDGHMALRHRGEVTHFRVSMLPTSYGEKCVIRLMKKEPHLADLDKLGFPDKQLRLLKRHGTASQGMILVTGPTGSGKTTTIHALINFVNNPGINIVTLEDPVEMTIPGVNHVGVQERGGVTFAGGLRSILRQDPDVVFVGEMRDEEVSRIAVKASLTGHLVLSTLHTNGAVETVARLMDMGLEGYLIASCLRLVVAQRLLRRICTACGREEPLTDDLREEFQLDEADLGPEYEGKTTQMVPVGCEKCMDSGYKGRVAVYEVLALNDELKACLRTGADEQVLLEAAQRSGMNTMFEEGIKRGLEGITSFQEVRRILAED